jgi:hypothetical protein
VYATQSANKRAFLGYYGVFIAVMLLALAWRFGGVVDFWEYPDEVWTVWQVQGNLADALTRTPFDWSPLYPVVIWAWVQIVGNMLETARLLNPLLGAMTLALLFQVGRQLPIALGITLSLEQRTRIGWLNSLAFGVMAFPIFIGVDSRAYGLLMLWGVLTLWYSLRWLSRPTWRNTIACIVCHALLFYTSYTGVVFSSFLGAMMLLIALCRFGKALAWRQLLAIPIGGVLLCLPEVQHLLQARGRITRSSDEILGGVPQELFQIYQELTGSTAFVVFLAIVASLFLLWQVRHRQHWFWGVILVLWTLALPTLLTLMGSEFLLRSRYVWWIVLGACLGVAWVLGISRNLSVLGAVVLLGLGFISQNFVPFRLTVPENIPFRYVLSNLADEMRPEDVLIIDPACMCGRAYEWDYFVPRYFASGYLPIVNSIPDDAQRVWYLSSDANRTASLQAQVANGRIASTYYGPWYFIVRLYERPANLQGVAFGESVALHTAEIIGNPFAVGEGESITVRLQWSAQQALSVDYSMSVALFQNDVLVAQSDSAPSSGNTSTWQMGNFYEDIRTLRAPENTLYSGDLEVRVAVYQWWDGTRLVPQSNTLWRVTTDNYLVIHTLTFWAW